MCEDTEYSAFARRIIRAFARRAAEDIDTMAELAALAVDLDDALKHSVSVLRDDYSWAEIGYRLGVSRQAAHQRFGGASS